MFLYQLLTSHYEQRWKYYLQTEGQADQCSASEEELYLSRKLFWNLFKALDKKVNHVILKCNSSFNFGCVTFHCLATNIVKNL